MSQSNFVSRLRQFDAYPKTLDDFSVRTFGGAIITLFSSAFMLLLFFSELNYFLTTDVNPELFVDTARGQKLKININITFPKMACAYLSIDAMDASGEQQVDVNSHILKTRLQTDGTEVGLQPQKHDLGDPSEVLVKSVATTLDPTRCESCYGAEQTEGACCNTCEQVQAAYRNKGWAFDNPDSIIQCSRENFMDTLKQQQDEGCLVTGYLEVNKVAGNFHFAPGKSFSQHHMHVHDLKSLRGIKFDLSHVVNHLSFGKSYPGIVNPLDGSVVNDTSGGKSMFQYFVKVVPTTYSKLDGTLLYTNQFSTTTHRKQSDSEHELTLPGLFVQYELSPMMVKYTEVKRSFMHFLTGLCSIIGGVFTVASLIDSFVYHSSKAIQQKLDLGKAS